MNFLALVPLKDWLYLGAIAVLLAGAALFVHHERDIGAAKIKAAVKVAAAKAAASAASETERRVAAIQGVVHDTQVAASAVAADASAAARERDAARVQLDAYVRRSAVPASAPAAAGSAPAADPDVLLAGLLNQAWQRSLDLAAEADRRGLAGSACERSYDALTAPAPQLPASSP